MNQYTLKQQLYIILMVVLTTMATAVSAQTEQIGEVVFSRGAVSAQSQAGQIRVLGKQAPVYQGDIVTAGPRSFSVIKLVDDSRISIRPDTVFSFEQFSVKSGEESAAIRLFKGGLRTITGYISNTRPDAFELHTSVATIGIRGTDFDARLCEIDCMIDQQSLEKKKTIKDNTIAKVAFLKGNATAVSLNNTSRDLKVGSSIYEGDTLKTARQSYLLIAFNDKSRISLKAETELKIEEHKFNSADPDRNSAVYELVKGGVRALTGLISKRNQNAYKVKSPTATIGIRGTGYDLLWLGPCTGGATSCGLSGSVWLGSIYAKNDAGEFELLQDQSFIIRLIDAPADIVDLPPVMDIPRPDGVDINFEELFSGQEDNDVPSGLYVNTREGIVYMERDGEIIEMLAGEGGFVSTDGSIIVKLVRPNTFQTDDPYFQTINEEFETLYELLEESVIQQNEFECIVQ